jgi:hypothetical protein
MKPSVSRDNKLEVDAQFTTERIPLNIVAKDEVNQNSQNYDPMGVPNNKIAPCNDAKVVSGIEEENKAD